MFFELSIHQRISWFSQNINQHNCFQHDNNKSFLSIKSEISIHQRIYWFSQKY